MIMSDGRSSKLEAPSHDLKSDVCRPTVFTGQVVARLSPVVEKDVLNAYLLCRGRFFIRIFFAESFPISRHLLRMLVNLLGNDAKRRT